LAETTVPAPSFPCLARQLDHSDTRPYNGLFTVMHFSDLLNCTKRPAPARWAALFLGGNLALLQLLEARMA
jgi:hypothetical protein